MSADKATALLALNECLRALKMAHTAATKIDAELAESIRDQADELFETMARVARSSRVIEVTS